MSNITISGTYKNAWQKLHGSKGAIWSVAAVIVLAFITMAFIRNLIVTNNQTLYYWLSYIILPAVLYLWIGPFVGSSIMVAIKRYRNETVNIRTGHQYLSRFIRTSITMMIIGLLADLVTIVTSLPTIGQSLGRHLAYFNWLGILFFLLIYTLFLLSIPLIVDKNYGIFKALGHSLQRMKSHWPQVFIILLFAFLILFITYIPAIMGLILANKWLAIFGLIFLIIALIWFLPFLFLLVGHIYHQIIDEPQKI